MNFDEILRRTGEIGVFQIILYILLGFVGIPTGEQNLLMVFLGQDQDHWCTIPELANMTAEQQKYIGVPYDSEKKRFDRCQRYDLNFSQYSSEELSGWNRTLMIDNTTAVKFCSAWTFDKTDGLSTVNEQFGLVCDRDWLTALATTIYMAGFMVGCMFYGSISDRYGRHITLIITLFTEICFGLIAAFVPFYWLFVIFRFLAGTAAAGSFTTAFVMVMEMIGPKYRVILGVFVQGWFALGFMLVSGLGYAVRDHVMLQVCCSVPTILLLSYWWLVPESPRWLISEGEIDKSYKVVSKMAKWNKTKAPEKHLFYSEHGKDVSAGMAGARSPNFFDLLRTPNMRKRSLNIFFNWFVNSLVYYGLSLSAGSLGGSIYFNTFLSGAVELPAYVVLIFTMDRFGRRKSIIASMLIGGIACLACCPILDNEPLQPLLVTFAMIGKFGISASFSIIYVYSAEVFPTVVRNVGVGSGSMHARIGGLVAPQIARLSSIWRPLPSIIFGLFSIAAGLLFILLPETYGQVLPETLVDGENFGIKQSKTHGNEEAVGLNKMNGDTEDQEGERA
ncbi:organic cation transporter protein-like isoform X2 [Lineus longissimus]|uniref:organic cation transporter protein-like isoform X2 n=1 Tax=Lineus longissimus TaxID=88925 RepID=UPI00315DAE74